MKQTEVKIIGLTLNQRLGILQSCQLKFDQENKLIAIKGEVGSGKTTLQKGLQLGTLGSETLKDDKELYGVIDQEIQLIDGAENVFVGCKSDKSGALNYVIYTKDEAGKINKNPVIDGVKATPANYLKNMQTALTWRMDELTSENQTVQKRILLELYKSELAELGVVFDVNSLAYSDSILGRIDHAINDRTQKDFQRKQVGGFQNQLEPFGIYPIEDVCTIPKRVDISELEKQKNKLQYDIDNVAEVKKQQLSKIQNEANAIVLKLKEENAKIKIENAKIESELEKKKEQFKQNEFTRQGIMTDFDTLLNESCISEENHARLVQILDSSFENIDISASSLLKELDFDETGKITNKPTEFETESIFFIELLNLFSKKKEYVDLNNQPAGDTSKLEKELEIVMNNLILAKENNKKCDMCDSYLSWHEANEKVMQLRNEYANLLKSINTGVDGLNISVHKENEDAKLDIFLTYNGQYDSEYFNNKDLEPRKLSSYSGTQKPLICLLLQNYLLSKKPKALRYLYIDNVPIDNKTKALLNKMGEELGLTVIVNITGDFTKESLENGEILIEGGHVFFNN